MNLILDFVPEWLSDLVDRIEEQDRQEAELAAMPENEKILRWLLEEERFLFSNYLVEVSKNANEVAEASAYVCAYFDTYRAN